MLASDLVNFLRRFICHYFVVVVILVHVHVICRLAGRLTVSLSCFSHFSACRSSSVKLLSGIKADCIILLPMLSLVCSDKSS